MEKGFFALPAQRASREQMRENGISVMRKRFSAPAGVFAYREKHV